MGTGYEFRIISPGHRDFDRYIVNLNQPVLGIQRRFGATIVEQHGDTGNGAMKRTSDISWSKIVRTVTSKICGLQRSDVQVLYFSYRAIVTAQ